MTEFLGTWGWYILAAGFFMALWNCRHKGAVVAWGAITAAILSLTVGFNPPLPQSLGIAAGAGFVLGLLMGVIDWLGWILLAGLVFATFPAVEREYESWSVILVALAAVVLYLMTGWNAALEAIHHPVWAAALAVGYALLGIGWSIFKWHRFVDKSVDAMREAQRQFVARWRSNIEQGGLARWRGFTEERRGASLQEELKTKLLTELRRGEIPDELVEEWLYNAQEAEKPSVLRNKEHIINWIAFWPWSMLTYFLYDLLRDLLETIWKQMRAVYQQVVDRKYEKLDQRLIRKTAA